MHPNSLANLTQKGRGRKPGAINKTTRERREETRAMIDELQITDLSFGLLVERLQEKSIKSSDVIGLLKFAYEAGMKNVDDEGLIKEFEAIRTPEEAAKRFYEMQDKIEAWKQGK